MRAGRATGLRVGAIARQILGGVPPERIPIDNLRPVPTFDWRQLRRWNIDVSAPAARDRTFASSPRRSGTCITGTSSSASLAVVVVQAVLITGLLRQRARLRLAEQTIRAREATLRTSYERIQQMAGRLINAQEAARAGVAQDLHDDVCQQLVFVSMGVSTLKHSSGQLQDGETQEALATLEADTQKVFEGLRRLSQDLHPATLRLLGLAGGAAHALCRGGEASRRGGRLHGRSRPAQRPQGRRGVLLPDRPGGAAERHRARRRAPPVRLPGGIGRSPGPRRDRRWRGIRRRVRASRRRRAGPGDDERTCPRRRRDGRHREPAGKGNDGTGPGVRRCCRARTPSPMRRRTADAAEAEPVTQKLRAN